MNRLGLLKQLLEVSRQAVKMKERLLRDQLRTAVAKEVHLKQYEAVEKELAEAVADLIKRQYADASKSITEKGARFDPRDWDDELIDTALPILMKHAGQAAAAQMLLMGVDVAPRKKVGRTEKGGPGSGDNPGHPFRGNQWTGEGRVSQALEKLDRMSRGREFVRPEDVGIDPPPQNGPFGAVEYSKLDFHKAKIKELSPQYITSFGDTDQLYVEGIRKYVSSEDIPPIDAVRWKGRDYVVDGHHRLAAALLRGDSTIRTRFLDLQPPVQIQKPSRRRGVEGIVTKASRATDWLLALEDGDEELIENLWPSSFALPGGGTVDLGFATEWPAWMKEEISKQMKECFEQPFWAGINDTTAEGIQRHVLRGIEEGWSIREIRDGMVGDGLDEFYHNRGVTIARTESGNALNGARIAAMDRLQEEVPGLKIQRTWMSVLGTTTRDSHADLDGVPADEDGLWELGGVRVPWPGHWSLDAGERCNCQCTVLEAFGMSDESARELIEEYNERLAEERSLRDMRTKGDLPGHPFRGNQWTGGQGSGGSTDELPEGEQPGYEGARRTFVPARDITSQVRTSNSLNSGLNVTQYVEYEEDGVLKKACFKPKDGESLRVVEMFAGKQTANELAAGIVDEEMGLGLGGKVEMARIDGEDGVLMEWINDGAELAYDASFGKAAPNGPVDFNPLTSAKGFDNMLYYDLLTGNADRHLGNYFVKNGEIKIIDNGMSFGKNEEYEDPRIRMKTVEIPEIESASRSVPPSPEFKAGLRKIVADRDRVDKRMEEVGMEKANREAFWKRAEYLNKIGGNWGTFNESSLRELAVMAEGRTPW